MNENPDDDSRIKIRSSSIYLQGVYLIYVLEWLI